MVTRGKKEEGGQEGKREGKRERMERDKKEKERGTESR